MTLSLDDVKRIAELAGIETSESEANVMQTQLASIFNLIEQMRVVDTATVKPMSHTQNITQRLRDDIVTEVDRRELLQSAAPQVEECLYLVPKVIE